MYCIDLCCQLVDFIGLSRIQHLTLCSARAQKKQYILCDRYVRIMPQKVLCMYIIAAQTAQNNHICWGNTCGKGRILGGIRHAPFEVASRRIWGHKC